MVLLPIIERELRVAARKRSTFWLRVVAALVSMVIGIGLMLLATAGVFATATLGGVLFSILTWLAFGVAMSSGLFFTSGVVLACEKTKRITDVRGLWRRAPRTAVLWLGGFFLITGMPPSGIFLAKFLILKEAMAQKHYWLAGVFLFFLAMLFAGMAKVFISMTFGEREAKPGEKPFAEPAGMLVPAAIFFACVIFLGLFMPAWLSGLIQNATGNI